MFHGSIVALATPMQENGSLDEKGLVTLVDYHLEQGTDGIVVIGTTGEAATLSDEEQVRVMCLVIKQVAGRVPIIAGTGSNSTAKTLTLTRNAMEAGVDACLIVTPYYNKPTQEGLYLHYRAIAEGLAIPIILYNVPGRTAVDMLPETVARLADIPNIVGIKEATGKLDRTQKILELCDNKIDIYSGDDLTSLDLMLNGAKGVISVTANVAPKLMHEMCLAALQQEPDRATKINEKLIPLHKALFVEANPIPTKWALHKMGMIPPGIRLPLTPLTEQNYEVVTQAMRRAGINV